jgi:hypothetical protein
LIFNPTSEGGKQARKLDYDTKDDIVLHRKTILTTHTPLLSPLPFHATGRLGRWKNR